MDVAGKTAIVTGSSAGVGRQVAIDLARRGASVVVNYSRSEDEAKEALQQVEAAGGKALLVKADVADDDAVNDMVRRTFDTFGGLHILVNNAATTHFVNFADLDGMKSEYWDRIFAVNVKGAFFCSRAASRAMRESVQAGSPAQPSSTSPPSPASARSAARSLTPPPRPR